MSFDSIVSLLLGIPLSIITGLYTGVIVSRYVRFSELRSEALRIIRSIEYMQEDQGILVSNTNDVAGLKHISSDLFFLKHQKAAETVNGIHAAIEKHFMSARAGRLSFGELDQACLNWQKMARNARPNKLVLWSLWGNL